MEYKDILALLGVLVGIVAIGFELWVEYKFKQEEKKRK